MIFKRLSLDDPEADAVSLEEVATRLRIGTAEDNEELRRQIRSAREIVEHRTGRQLMPGTWRGVAEKFPECGRPIVVDDGLPFRGVDSITYVDLDGQTQTLAAELYQSDTHHEPGAIKPIPGESWPAVKCGLYASVEVTVLCGYADGDGNPDVPQVAKDAILMLLGKWRDRLGIPGQIDEAWREEFERMIAPLLWKY